MLKNNWFNAIGTRSLEGLKIVDSLTYFVLIPPGLSLGEEVACGVMSTLYVVILDISPIIRWRDGVRKRFVKEEV